ncbi:hypothetical protein D3OALGB2SA_4250 [Olavius algarvensis associated proteobacterium Delta 3]|nr:hypothetical protein D3OALGB2SA_4250 [Olavius algarvensis associated proteobacterium Delta 3]
MDYCISGILFDGADLSWLLHTLVSNLCGTGNIYNFVSVLPKYLRVFNMFHFIRRMCAWIVQVNLLAQYSGTSGKYW